MKPAKSVLDLIGNTPMLKIQHLDTGCCELYLKLENQNPGGSIKDRIALSMITAAERDGKLKPGGIIIEATAGNTGLGLALIAALKNAILLTVSPELIDYIAQVSAAAGDTTRGLGATVIDFTQTALSKAVDRGLPLRNLAVTIGVRRGATPADDRITVQRTDAPGEWEFTPTSLRRIKFVCENVLNGNG